MMIDKKLIWGSLITATLLFTGCSSDKESSEHSVSAKSTFANATVCVDDNSDGRCQEDEIQTTTKDDGSFALSYKSSAHKNAQLVAQGGFNLVTLQENPEEKVLIGSLDEMASHNVNTLTTLIQEAVETGLNYKEAKAYIASRYNLEDDLIDHDPLELLQNPEQQVYFLSVRAMETYRDREDENLSLPSFDDNTIQIDPLASQARRSVARQATVSPMSIEDADMAISNSNIFDFDIGAYLQRLSELFSQFFDDLLSLFGFGDDISDYEFDEATLEPLPLKLYHNDINKSSEFWKEKIWDYIEMMREGDEVRVSKNHKDLDYILTNTQHKEVKSTIFLLYSIMSTEASIQLLLEGIDRPYFTDDIGRFDVAFMMLFAIYDIHRGDTLTKDTPYKFEHAHLYEEYFKNSSNNKFRDIIANSMVHISDKDGLELVTNYIDAHYISSVVDYDYGETPDSYTPENVVAENLTRLLGYFKRPMASELLIAFYEAHDGDENLKRKIRKAFSKIANENTVEKLYALASKLPVLMHPLIAGPELPAHEYVGLFKRVKFYNKEVAPFILETLSPQYTFGDASLKDQINALFVERK